jgi:hypothetical protein
MDSESRDIGRWTAREWTAKKETLEDGQQKGTWNAGYRKHEIEKEQE